MHILCYSDALARSKLHLYSTLSVLIIDISHTNIPTLAERWFCVCVCVCVGGGGGGGGGGGQCYIVRRTHAPGAHLVPLLMSPPLFSLKIHSLSEAAGILPLWARDNIFMVSNLL